MYKAGICGHFVFGKNSADGQTVKTRIMADELKKALGEDAVMLLDTCGWGKKPFSLPVRCFLMAKRCENIIILPGQNGIKILIPLFVSLNRMFKRRLHYVVVGGWLPELLGGNRRLRARLRGFSGIYPETSGMIDALARLGVKNTIPLPNFKRLGLLSEKDLVYPQGEPYRLCTFSRIIKEKGIEDAVEAVKKVNEKSGRIIYCLDIYGNIDRGYREEFDELRRSMPGYISYKGVINYDKSVETIKNYFALLFPTYYGGEGFAGTIIDAFASGVPVVASNWKYNPEIIRHGRDGFVYDRENTGGLEKILTEIASNPQVLIRMKPDCLLRASEYMPETVISEFIKNL